MLLFRNSTVALLALLATSAAAQTPAAQPAPGDAEYLIFHRGLPIGREQANLARTKDGWIIVSTGRTAPPYENTLHRFELKYSPDWQPIELKIEATAGRTSLGLATSFGGTTAISEITQNGLTNAKTDLVSPRTIVLPNNFYAGYEALAARLAGASVGTELPLYVVPQAEVKLTVKAIREEPLAVPGGTLLTRRYEVVVDNPGVQTSLQVVVDQRSRFVRLEVPGARLAVIRSDVAGVATRLLTARNPTDVDVSIPGNGFNLAGTLTTPPAAAARMRYPAVVLVPGSGPIDRDSTVAGVPIFAQLAGALAERGVIVLRYDKRGVGQSGGRTETATLQDFAEDLRAVVRWMEKRQDVDKKRIAVAGHSEGGWIALLAASREKKIASLILTGTAATPGTELILEQQRHALDQMKASAEERKQKVELQMRIHNAVLTGKGWEGIPEELRTQADTPWFASFLAFDPAKVMTKVKQPILILQAALDRQVPASHGATLAELAKARRKAPAVELKHLAGVNHLLVRATTGEVSEYPVLQERAVVPEVGEAIAGWLAR
jgi:alpha-beta hydrolase superfamily lysophospholipase